MSKDSNNWRDEVWTRYASLFDGSLPFRTGLSSVPDGWRENVAELLDRLEMIVRADKFGRLTVTRLLHHQGMLEIDYQLTNFRLEAMVEEVVELAKARAACSCALCGTTANRYTCAADIDARCDTHRKPGSVRIHPPWPLVKVDRAIEAGVSRIKRCRLYDRDRDIFVDIDPGSIGIPRSP